MNVLRASTYQRMPWKNGGGETSEIAISPAGATLDTLDWRISMAVVATDGPFSIFPGIDRTLCLLDGAGMELDFGNGDVKTVTQQTAPLPFPADVALQARLLDGTITDLNVMTRRDRCGHRVSRLLLDAGEERQVSVAQDIKIKQLLVFCEHGEVSCTTAEHTVTLASRDGLLLQGGTMAAVSLHGAAKASVCVIELYEIKSP